MNALQLIERSPTDLQIAEAIADAVPAVTTPEIERLRQLILYRPDPRRRVTQIKAVVSLYFGVRVSEMMGKRRWEEFVWPRHVAMYLAYRDMGCRLSMTARQFRVDHGTVFNAVKQVSARISTEARRASEVVALQNALGVSQ